MPRFLPATYRTLLLISVLVVVAFLVVVLFQNLKLDDDSNRLVEHTYNVLLQSGKLSAALDDVEIGHLRFLINGAEERLNLYKTGMREVPAALSELDRLIADNPSQQTRLHELRGLIATRLDVIAGRIQVRRSQGVAAAAAQFSNDGGAVVGRRIKALQTEMMTEEQTLLARRHGLAQQQARRTLQLTAVGSVILLALLTFINYMLERDVVLRRRAEEEVRRNETLFRGLFDNASVGIAILSDAGDFQLVNARFCEIANYASDQLLNRTFQSILGEEMAQFHLTDSPTAGKKQLCLRGDNSTAWVNLTVSSLPASTGASNRFVVVIEDINAQVKAEAALQAANLSLVRSNESLQEFAYVVGHDLQEPLRTISMYSQLALREYKAQLDGRGEQFLGIIGDGARRMSQLIQSLLAYAQASSDDKQSYQRVDLDKLLNETLEALRARIEEEHAVIDCDTLPEVEGDPVRLHQVLQNLIGNSLKYRRPDVPPQIQITCRKQAADWLFRVTDNGLGFPSQSSERIFGIFKRLHGREIPGTGVGLAVVKTVVERHGGQVWAESAGDNRGATFSFTIPIGKN